MCCTDIPNVCVLDVEGTDGAEVAGACLPCQRAAASLAVCRPKANAILMKVACVCSAWFYRMFLSSIYTRISSTATKLQGKCCSKQSFEVPFHISRVTPPPTHTRHSIPSAVNARKMAPSHSSALAAAASDSDQPLSFPRARVLLLYVIRCVCVYVNVYECMCVYVYVYVCVCVNVIK